VQASDRTPQKGEGPYRTIQRFPIGRSLVHNSFREADRHEKVLSWDQPRCETDGIRL
jgi:hypothetical protein